MIKQSCWKGAVSVKSEERQWRKLKLSETWAFPGAVILPSSVSFWHGALKFTVKKDQPWWKVKPLQPWSCGGRWADNHSPSECLARGKGDSQDRAIKMTFPSDNSLLSCFWRGNEEVEEIHSPLFFPRNLMKPVSPRQKKQSLKKWSGRSWATITPSSVQHRNEDGRSNEYVLYLAQRPGKGQIRTLENNLLSLANHRRAMALPALGPTKVDGAKMFPFPEHVPRHQVQILDCCPDSAPHPLPESKTVWGAWISTSPHLDEAPLSREIWRMFVMTTVNSGYQTASVSWVLSRSKAP